MVLGLHIMVNMLLNVTNLNKYGCALLYKAQEEADPLVAMPKKEGVPLEDSNIGGCVKRTINGESLAASVSNNEEQGGSSNNLDEAADNGIANVLHLAYIAMNATV
ncbi:NASP-related protein sim3 [Abeliophyllum distichum]|uniref:NASP-related protein sim3 n=1 Tax=Abeliophyllum distichum TaxID=126358 RepID=A0ABD1SEH2_9LAMI